MTRLPGGAAASSDVFGPFEGGYTLLELIVVITLLSMMLFFTIPRIQPSVLSDSRKSLARHLIGQVRVLREKAVRDQRVYLLNVDLERNALWVSNPDMTDAETDQAIRSAYSLSEDARLVDVEYPDKVTVRTGQAAVRFFPKGYADRVVIHVSFGEGEEAVSYFIEPFLTKVKIFDGFRGLEG